MIVIVFGVGVIGVALLTGLGLISSLRPHADRVHVRIGHAAGTALAFTLTAIGMLLCAAVAIPALSLDHTIKVLAAWWRRPRTRRIVATTALIALIEGLVYWLANQLGGTIVASVTLGQIAGVIVCAAVMGSSNETLREQADAAETAWHQWELKCREAVARYAAATDRAERYQSLALTYRPDDHDWTDWMIRHGVSFDEEDAA